MHTLRDLSEPEKLPSSNSENASEDLIRSPCAKPPLCAMASRSKSMALAMAIQFHPEATETDDRSSPVMLMLIEALSLKRWVCSTQVGGWVSGCEWVSGWVDGERMGGWVDGWMSGWGGRWAHVREWVTG